MNKFLFLVILLSGMSQAATLSETYKGDIGIANDSRVLFASDFENDLAGWSNYSWADPGLGSTSIRRVRIRRNGAVWY